MRLCRRAALLLAWLLALAGPAHAQGFGKNKVHYEPLDWAVFETPHVRLHYYAAEESLARRVAALAESVCVEFDGVFRMTPARPVPFLLYSHHHLFQQTNATPELVSEGVGGLTELIKGRVLVPHDGSWHRLRWVTRHELVHAYMLEKLAVVMREQKRATRYFPPLWFIEGLAEFVSTTWDEDAEGLLRDAMVTGEALPITASESITGSVLMYKEGQAFLLWLAERHGRGKVIDLLENWWRADDFETVFRMTFGMPLAEADHEWFRDMQRRYYPAVAERQRPEDVARRLTPSGRYNLGPRVVPGGSPADTALRFCYFQAAETGVDLMLDEPARDGRRRSVRLLRGGASATFESFHLFRNRPGASPSGLVAVTSKTGGRDALHLIDLGRGGRVVRRLEFPTLVAMNDPSLVPGDSAAVFTGTDYAGRADLYRASWAGGGVRLERLTRDDFADFEPDVSPDGRWVAFASDRGERDGRFSLFRLSLETGALEALGDPGAGDDRQPAYSPDGRWIAFRSSRDGSSDLWVRAAEPAAAARRVTRLLGPASDPDWLPGGRGLLFTAQRAITFQTYAVEFDPDTLAEEPESPSEHVAVIPAVLHRDGPKRYARQLGFDLVQNAVTLDPAMGAGGAGQIALSDMLGNEQIYLLIANDSGRFGDFWDGWQLGVTYLNQSRRLNWGVGLFRLTEIYDPDFQIVRREKRVGITLLASYPLSRFTRIEGTTLIRHAQDHVLRSGLGYDADLVSNFLTVVHDNVRWSRWGPTLGTRVYGSAGYTRDLTRGLGDYANLLGELRHYRMPVWGLVSATRAQVQHSFGEDVQTFYLGGRFSLRGYDYRVLAGETTLLFQQEFRFPLLQGLVLAVPTRWMLPSIGGAVFADAGWARDGPLDRSLGSAGVAWYVGGGYYPAIRWNYAWRTLDFRHFSPRPVTQFALIFNF
jgi:Tol biopolymer transport system component